MIILLKTLYVHYQKTAVEKDPMMIMITLMATIMMLERAMITKDLTHVTLTTNQNMINMTSLTKSITIINIEVIFREEYLLSNLIKHHAS
jgi:hypothetical protein